MTKSNDFGLLYKFNYPPYQIVGYSNNSFLVCGGGGAAKTGVPNKIEMFQISEINGVDHLSVPNLKINLSFDSGTKAIMSLRRHFNYILTGEGGDLCEYILCGKNDDDTVEFNDGKGNDDGAIVRDRKNKHDERKNEKNADEFDMKLHRKLSPCFPSPNQVVNKNIEVNIVRYGDQGGNSVIAGGSNGIVRVYQRYSDDRPMDLVLQREFNDVSVGGHAVVDLDVSPSLDEMVTVCDNPDGKYARVWSISRGVKITELALMSSPRGGSVRRIDSVAYRFKHCRYAAASLPSAAGVAGSRRVFLLYATHQPVVSDKSRSAFVSVWGPLDAAVGIDYQLVDVVDLGTNLSRFGTRPTKMRPTALSTSHCGSMVAVGSGEGAVAVYRLSHQTHNLSRIYNLPKAHSFFVTDITFLPSSRALNTGHQFELLSIGVDNMLRYHRAPHRPAYLRLEGLYKLLSVFLLIFFCDRVLLLLSLF